MPEYIDREAVYKMACRGCTRHGDEIGSCYEEEPCEELQSEFASAPAADVEPVRHGRWAKGDQFPGWLCCSACRDAYVLPVWVESGKWKFCPSCGAKMDGGEEEV